MAKILIIDDDENFLKSMSEKLVSAKYEVVVADDGDVGLKKTITEKPDLILLDMMMPKVDGLTFLRKLKAEKDVPNIPIIVTSNMTSVDKISEGIQFGIKGYIIKSNESLNTIVREIEKVLHQNS